MTVSLVPCTIERGAVRLGLKWVAGLRAEAAARIVAQRERAPFRSIADLATRSELHRDELASVKAIHATPLESAIETRSRDFH